MIRRYPGWREMVTEALVRAAVVAWILGFFLVLEGALLKLYY